MAKYEGKNSSFALRLKQHRELCRLTQQQVADILNINRTTYTKYETGVSEPSHEVLRKLFLFSARIITLCLVTEVLSYR